MRESYSAWSSILEAHGHFTLSMPPYACNVYQLRHSLWTINLTFDRVDIALLTCGRNTSLFSRTSSRVLLLGSLLSALALCVRRVPLATRWNFSLLDEQSYWDGLRVASALFIVCLLMAALTDMGYGLAVVVLTVVSVAILVLPFGLRFALPDSRVVNQT